MGVLPCQFKNGESAESLGLKGDETFDITGLENGIKPQMDVMLTITARDGTKTSTHVLLRIDTPIEVDYYLHGGILPYVLRELIGKAA
jgi:aconitate hydratase